MLKMPRQIDYPITGFVCSKPELEEIINEGNRQINSQKELLSKTLEVLNSLIHNWDDKCHFCGAVQSISNHKEDCELLMLRSEIINNEKSI